MESFEWLLYTQTWIALPWMSWPWELFIPHVRRFKLQAPASQESFLNEMRYDIDLALRRLLGLLFSWPLASCSIRASIKAATIEPS